MLLSFRENGLTSLFKEVRVFKVFRVIKTVLLANGPVLLGRHPPFSWPLVAQLLDPPYRAIGYRYTYHTYVFQVSQGITLYPPKLWPIAAKWGVWQGVSQLKLLSGGCRAIRGHRWDSITYRGWMGHWFFCHFRRFLGCEEQNPLFLQVECTIRILTDFRQTTYFSAGDRNPVFQNGRFDNPRDAKSARF